MFKVGFTLPNIIALILGLCVLAYFTLVQKEDAEIQTEASSSQR
jgi:hypothetical protein